MKQIFLSRSSSVLGFKNMKLIYFMAGMSVNI
jgi:hypothetical protein